MNQAQKQQAIKDQISALRTNREKIGKSIYESNQDLFALESQVAEKKKFIENSRTNLEIIYESIHSKWIELEKLEDDAK